MHYNNLLTIQNLEEDCLISYSDTEVYVDDRYFASYRPSYDIDKVVFVLRNAFLSFLKIYEIEEDKYNIFINDEYNYCSIIGFINKSVNSLDKLINNKSYTTEHKEKFIELKNFINESLKAVNNKYNDSESSDDSESISYPEEETSENIGFINNLKTNIFNGINYITETSFVMVVMVENFFSNSYDYIIGLVKK